MITVCGKGIGGEIITVCGKGKGGEMITVCGKGIGGELISQIEIEATCILVVLQSIG